MMESSISCLALLSLTEITAILVVMGVMTAVVVGVIVLAISLSRRTGAAPPAPPGPQSTVKLSTCPGCGLPLPINAPQGLCPRCVMQVGIGSEDEADPAFRDASGKPNPPDPGDLAKYFPQLEIIELLGQGGMGAVYKARQKDLDRLVALKVLPGGAGSDPAFAERFMREARALARLNHPNIVSVYDFGQIGRNSPAAGSESTGRPATAEAVGPAAQRQATARLYYFVMEFVEGPNLRQLMHSQRLAPREAIIIVPKICEALQFAHDEGIVHRDIKPENILIDKKGRVKIADFGIAKIAGKRGDAALTGAKDVIGTPHYMAPEQIERPAEVDHRADIYSLGVVFYEMLTGELPLGKFEAPSQKVQVDVRLDQIVLRSLAKAPERRYQHVSEVKTDVETIAEGSAKSDVRSQSAEGKPGRGEPNRGSWQPVLAALLLVGCILFWGLMGYLTYIQPILLERASESAAELSAAARFFFHLASGVHRLGFLLFPLALLVTAGAFVWLFLSALRPGRRGWETPAAQRARVWATRKAWGFGIASLCFCFGTLIWGGAAMRAALNGMESGSLWVALLNVVAALGFGVASLRQAQAASKGGGGTVVGTDSTEPGAGARSGAPRERFASAVANPDARFSRLAIVGACWPPLFFISTLLYFTVHVVAIPEGGVPPGPAWWQLGLSFTVLPLGLLAPFGTTLCGVIALSQIRRSAGRLCGLGLALFDALLFPLLILDGLILWGVYLLLCQSLEWVGFRPGTEVAIEKALLPAAFVILLSNVWLVRGAWQRTMRMTGRAPTGAERASAAAWRRVAIPLSGVLLLGAAALMVGVPLQSRSALALQERQQEDRSELLVKASRERAEASDDGAGLPFVSAETPDAAFVRVPPVVTHTFPPSGARGVDPSVTELRVNFSKPMRDGCWSWVQVDDRTFPEVTGEPRFSGDPRTCILPVRLAPGRTYVVWINSHTLQEFQDRNGTAAIPYLLIFETKETHPSGARIPNSEAAPGRVTVGQDGDAQFRSIQEAVHAVADGGLVEIGKGHYEERLVLTRPVKLIGAGWDKTVIGPSGPLPAPSREKLEAFQQRYAEASTASEGDRLRTEAALKLAPPVVLVQGAIDVELTGLRLTQPGTPPEGSLLSWPVIDVRAGGLILRDSAVVGAVGSGVTLSEGARGDVDRCLIAAAWNRGVAVTDGSSLRIRNSDVRNCYYAGITVGKGCRATIERCRISGAAWHGIRYDGASPRIDGCLIFGNARSGIYASGSTRARVTDTLFLRNHMNGMSCWFDNQDRIEGNTFHANLREAISMIGASSPTVRSNIFSGHPVALVQGPVAGEDRSGYPGRPMVQYDLFWNNATNWVRAVPVGDGGDYESTTVEPDGRVHSLTTDPGFKDASRPDLRLALDSSARRDGMGAITPLPSASPWPLQAEEKAIIPDGDTRDYSHWKRNEDPVLTPSSPDGQIPSSR